MIIRLTCLILFLMLLKAEMLYSENIPALPSPNMYYITDDLNKYTLQDVITLQKAGKLKVAGSILSLGFSASIIWVHIPIPYQYTSKVLVLEYPNLSYIKLHSISNDKLIDQETSGNMLTFDTRYAKIRYPNFYIDSSATDLYLKISTEGALNIPARLIRSKNFFAYVENLSMLNGLLVGFGILAFITSILVYFFLRENIYLQYAFFLVSLAIYICTYLGIFFQFLWPDTPELNQLLSRFLYLTIFHLLYISEKLLDIKKNSRYLYKVYKVFYLLLLALFILFIFIPYRQSAILVITFAILNITLIFISAIYIYNKVNSLSSKVFIIGILFLALANYTNAFYLFGFISQTFFDVRNVEIGSLVQIIAFNVVIVIRINELNSEKQLILMNQKNQLENLVKERTEDLVQKQKDIINKNRLLEDQKLHLNVLVDEKTLELQKKLVELKNSEERFRFLTDTIPQFVWTVDENGKPEYVNKQFKEFTELNELEETFSFFNLVHPDDYENAINKWGESVKFQELYQIIIRYKRISDGSYRWHLVRAAPWKSEETDKIKWFGTSTDIDEEIRTKRLLSIRNEELRKINEDMDAFLYVTSHELRAPVANMQGITPILYEILTENNVPPQSEIYTLIKMLEESISQMDSVIINLEQISKVHRPVEEKREHFGLREELEEVVASLNDFIQEKNAVIRIELNECRVLFYSKENFKLILHKIISNSLTYSHPEIIPEITIKCFVIPDYIKISVMDNGIGISKEGLNKLFKMFRRAHNHVKGKGISLYLIKRILTNSGGKIEVSSKKGVGSTFDVYFPVSIASQE